MADKQFQGESKKTYGREEDTELFFSLIASHYHNVCSSTFCYLLFLSQLSLRGGRSALISIFLSRAVHGVPARGQYIIFRSRSGL